MAQLEEIEGVGAAYGQKLSAVGITTTDELLAKGATASGRKALAEHAGIGEGLILRWVNHADLYRVSGIGKQFAELLGAAGVDSVPELAQRVASNLCGQLQAVQQQKKLAGKVPGSSQVEDWVAQAKSLPRVVTH